MADRPVLLVTTVDIGDGQQGTIEVRQGDLPEDVAAAFCEQHGLPESVVEPLTQHLIEHLASEQGAQQDAHANGSDAEVSGDTEAYYRSQAAGSSRPGAHSYASGGEHSSGSSVYDRLYEKAMALRQKHVQLREERLQAIDADTHKAGMSATEVSRRMMREIDNGGHLSTGDRLYMEGILAQQKKQQLAEQRQAEKSAAEVQGVTFKPKISKMAQNLKKVHAGSGVAPWMRLSRNVNLSDRTHARMAELKQAEQAKELEDCTFKPKVNKSSMRMVLEKRVLKNDAAQPSNTYEQLYVDAKRRLAKQQELAQMLPEDVTFHPQLITAHRPHSGDSGKGGKAQLARSAESMPGEYTRIQGRSERPAAERLYLQWQEQRRRLEEAKRLAEGKIDPDTGKPRFQPETGREPNFERNYLQLPVGDYLYLQGVEAATRKEQQLRSQLEHARQLAQQKCITAASETLLQKLKRRRFAAIFEHLDTAQVGTIDLLMLVNNQHSLIQDMEPAVKSDVLRAAELLAEKVARVAASQQFVETSPTDLGAGQGLLNAQQFAALMEEVLQRFRGPRTYLMPTPVPKKHRDECTFRPTILEKSKELASTRRAARAIHELLYEEAGHRAAQHAQREAELLQELTKECTFRPQLQSNKLPKEGKAMRLQEALITTGIADASILEQMRQTDADEGRFVTEGVTPPEDLEDRVREALGQLLGNREASFGGKTEDNKTQQASKTTSAIASWKQDSEGDHVVDFADDLGLKALQQIVALQNE